MHFQQVFFALFLSAVVVGKQHHKTLEFKNGEWTYGNGRYASENVSAQVSCMDQETKLTLEFPSFCNSSEDQACYIDNASSSVDRIAKKMCPEPIRTVSAICSMKISDQSGPRIFGSNTKDQMVESKLKFSFLTKCHRLSLKAADSTEYAEIVRIESEKENAKQAAAAWRSWARWTSMSFVVVQGALVVLNSISLLKQEGWISEKHIESTWTMQKQILWIHRISLLICLILQVWLSLPEVILMVIAIGFADIFLQKLTSQGKDDKKKRMAFELILVVVMFLTWIHILNVNFDKSVVESQEKLRVALGDFGQEFKIKLD